MRPTIKVFLRDGRTVCICEASQPHFFQTGTCGTFVITGRKPGYQTISEFVFWESDVSYVEECDVSIDK